MKQILFALLLAVPLAAQSRFGEKIEIKLIEVDAVVTDGNGRRVYGLTADDFEVYEGKAKQAISNFAEYRAASAGTVRTDAGSVAGPAAKAAPAREPHSIMVLIDALSRRRFIRERALEDLEQLLASTLHEGDRASVIAWTPGFERPATVLEPTNDAAAVRRAIRLVAGTVTAAEQVDVRDTSATNDFFNEAAGFGAEKGAAFDPATQNLTTQQFGAEQDLVLLRRKCAAMQRLIATLAAQPGKKSFVYLSQSFLIPTDPGARAAGLAVIERLVRQANAAGVTVYAVRPYIWSPDDDDLISSGSVTPDRVDAARDAGFAGHNASMEALQHLSVPTGGTFGSGTDSVTTVGATIVDDLESYYSLAYRARSDGGDHERKITVRTRNPAYRVRNRTAFVEKSNETIARDSLINRLFASEGASDLEFQITEKKAQRTGRNRWILPIVLKIPTAQLRFVEEGTDRAAHVKILIAAAAGVSEVTPISEDALRVVAGVHDGAGFITYETKILGDDKGARVSIGVFDAESGYAGYRAIDTRNRMR